VSIGGPGGSTPPGFDPQNPRHLRLEFDDVSHEGLHTRGWRVPQPEDVEKLVQASDALYEGDVILCHCAAGVSRSTAAAYILRCLKSGPGNESEDLEAVVRDRPVASPNLLMVRYADWQLGRDGRMIRAVDRIADLKGRLGIE